MTCSVILLPYAKVIFDTLSHLISLVHKTSFGIINIQ